MIQSLRFASQFMFWSVLISLLLIQCTKTTDTPIPKSSAKSLDSPSIDGVTGASSTFDAASNSYTVTVPGGTDITAIKFTFTLPTGATAKPASGSVQNFTNPVTYTVTAEDGSTQTFTVKVVAKTCLVYRIENIDSKEFLIFQYDMQGRIVQVDGQGALLRPTTRPVSLSCSYNATGELIEARNSDGGLYKLTYQNKKLVGVVYSSNTTSYNFKINVNEANQITQWTGPVFCDALVYSNYSVAKRSICSSNYIITEPTYNNGQHSTLR